MRVSVFDFALEIDRQISLLPREQHYRRTSRAKRLIEELLPLSRFAFLLKYPGNQVEVEAFEDDGPIDGILHVQSDGQWSKLKVEVTYVGSYEEALRRELIWTEGSAPGRGPILRDKATRKIIAAHPDNPPYDDITPLAKDIVERFKKKCAKTYPRHTILLISFDDPTFYGIWAWRQLHAEIDVLGGLSGWVGEVHIINSGSNEQQMFA
jgi:hypothetical protein